MDSRKIVSVEKINASIANAALEPYTYSENFSSGTLAAWASYPLWQDTAYDPNFRIDSIVPGDPNISIVQKVTPYTNVDAYAGAQKLLDMYLVPDSTISLSYYLKSHLPFEFFTVRLAAGPDGKIDFTVSNPRCNQWVQLVVTFDDFVTQNPRISGRDRIKVNALAVLAKLPDADPAMPFYLGLDNIEIKGARMMPFRFTEPEMYKLSEWSQYIPQKHYYSGDTFKLQGTWPLDADRVELVITQFTDILKPLFTSSLEKKGESWSLKPFALDWPDGLYTGTLQAFNNSILISITEFTIHIAPRNIGGKHPRLWFDSETQKVLETRIRSDRFRNVYENLPMDAAQQRTKVPAEGLIFDLDQFPDEDWLPSWEAWGSRLYNTAESIYVNSLAYAFHKDAEAGRYTKNVLLRLAEFDNWTHPWQTKRGRFTEHRSGWWAHRLALAYDLTYDLMNEDERSKIRKAFWDFIVKTTHRMYVEDNDITGNTSNWISHTAGASLTMQAVMFGDGPDVELLEPCFTGAALKLNAFIRNICDPDGAFCEGLGYNNYTFHTLCQSLPALENVFGIDLNAPLNGTYKEYIWAGPIKNRRYFFFGDTEGSLNPITNWAWLLPEYRDPLLGWLYNYLKHGEMESNTKASMTGYMNLINKKNETFMDVLYETEDVPQAEPFGENPVKCFRKLGTTVFKSGWEPDDFIFVMRTGPFFNHQHIDQGSFWLAGRGSVFIEERTGGSYYEDPLYQPRYIQPVGHSTILINGNHQSQRVGDHPDFAEGFHDYAFIAQFLDGECAAFVSADIGRLYWGKVDGILRNVLYLKPGTILMLDTVIPGSTDADITLLYQTRCLKDIHSGQTDSTITKDGNVLHINHVYPRKAEVKAVETPHYLYTLREAKPLVHEGMLTITARTEGKPLVMANILTVTDGALPDITYEYGDGCIEGSVYGTPFVFSTHPGSRYDTGEFSSDAAVLTWTESTIFAALCTDLSKNGKILVQSGQPMTCEISSNSLKYCLEQDSIVTIGVDKESRAVTVNGLEIEAFTYDAESKTIEVKLFGGEGELRML
ncbi:MAG: heparinase II/III family protein [Candidatus Latescibacteria bacterium]|nr:heparinase II/III family protein [Candidatus Latescibacterota bacterium]